MNITQKLVVQYIPLANKLAYQKKKTLPKFVDVEDLKSAAYLGLVEAASRFDPSFNVAFSTFAYPRIFGAIHDFLREQGWLKRGDLTPVLSLESYMDDDKKCLKNNICSKYEGNIKDCFDHITNKLDIQAKSILRYYFIEEYSLKEVGDKIGLSESRVCQLIKKYKKNIFENIDLQEIAA